MENAHRKQILIVEDNEPLARSLRTKLESIGYEVYTKTAGKDAVSFAAAHPVELAILDVNLPDISGYEVSRQLRKIYHPWVLPVLMLTVNDKPVDQLRGFAHGADAYIVKPFDINELLQTISLLIGANPVDSRQGS
ncbi:MAG: response regulator [Candidatus Omnitrophica bacterium]|nr:response regulator [Candidatus Omnitrophota bacterium]MBI2174405.1 response regulator [Candidatus Omnitrophota bacterium]MBI3010573.1 response regulator [Candidatus Omnitrophota bacterium]